MPGRSRAWLRFKTGEAEHGVRGLHQLARRPAGGDVAVGEDRVEDLFDLVEHRLAHALASLGGQRARRACETADHHMLVMRQLPQQLAVQRPVRATQRLAELEELVGLLGPEAGKQSGGPRCDGRFAQSGDRGGEVPVTGLAGLGHVRVPGSGELRRAYRVQLQHHRVRIHGRQSPATTPARPAPGRTPRVALRGAGTSRRGGDGLSAVQDADDLLSPPVSAARRSGE